MVYTQCWIGISDYTEMADGSKNGTECKLESIWECGKRVGAAVLFPVIILLKISLSHWFTDFDFDICIGHTLLHLV